MTFSTHSGARKCCPKRFRSTLTQTPGTRLRGSAASARQALAPSTWHPVSLFSPPILLLDLLNLVFAHAEVVADLVDERFADRCDEILLVLRVALVRALEDQHAIGQRVAVAPAALRQRRALIQAEQRVGRLDVHFAEQLRARLVFDDDGDVLHRFLEAPRDRGERLSDEAFEGASFHVSASLESSSSISISISASGQHAGRPLRACAVSLRRS